MKWSLKGFYPQTDLGNARILLDRFKNEWRYDRSRKSWFVFGEHHWKLDDKSQVMFDAQNLSKLRRGLSRDVKNGSEHEKREGFARKCESERCIRSAVSLASVNPIFACTDKDWNTHPYKLPVANGVVDLVTKELSLGKPEDMISMNTDFDFIERDGEGYHPLWMKYLEDTFQGDMGLIRFIQRAVGYSLSGLTSEQVFFVLLGSGSNGKGVFINVLRALLGGMAVGTGSATFNKKSRSEIPNDLAKMAGARVVVAQEMSEKTEWDSERVKTLTGNDMVPARFLHKEFFEFRPQLKLWIATNHVPHTEDTSIGFRRRFILIPFNRHFDKDKGEVDAEMVDKLLKVLPDILHWALDGFQAWREKGLAIPSTVKRATTDSHRENSPLSSFLSQLIDVDETGEVSIDVLYQAYVQFAVESGEKPISKIAFGRWLGADNRFQQGPQTGRDRRRIWIGLRLREGRVVVN